MTETERKKIKDLKQLVDTVIEQDERIKLLEMKVEDLEWQIKTIIRDITFLNMRH